ncbi:MAG: methyltransferase domain-containing protein [Helicobacteraceae bacterium]|nr:methyltransferase domain-containing protein [Helicobacteraceae bacterium]
MQKDKLRWNEKYKNFPMPTRVAPIVEKYLPKEKNLKALDIACGKGRNSIYMAENGYVVDAIDISDVALSCVSEHKNITTQEVDLDTYEIKKDTYDVIVKCYYLDRRLTPYIIEALKSGGLLIYETYLEVSSDKKYHQPSNPDFLLKSNELLKSFSELKVIYYEEREETNLRGELVKIASLVAIKE